jgi:hypothetical protein
MFLRYYEKTNEDPMPHDLGRRMRKVGLELSNNGYITDGMISEEHSENREKQRVDHRRKRKATAVY